MNTIFDLYQTVYNKSINNETISQRKISASDIVIIIIFSLICIMICICIIKVFIRQCRKHKEQNDLHLKKNSISKINRVKKQIIETLN